MQDYWAGYDCVMSCYLSATQERVPYTARNLWEIKSPWTYNLSLIYLWFEFGIPKSYILAVLYMQLYIKLNHMVEQ